MAKKTKTVVHDLRKNSTYAGITFGFTLGSMLRALVEGCEQCIAAGLGDRARRHAAAMLALLAAVRECSNADVPSFYTCCAEAARLDAAARAMP